MRSVTFSTLHLVVFVKLKGGFRTAIIKPPRFSKPDTRGHAPINIEVCQYVRGKVWEIEKRGERRQGERLRYYTDDSDETGAVQGEAYAPLVRAIQREYHRHLHVSLAPSLPYPSSTNSYSARHMVHP
jgi:hypothetical protein